MKQKYLKYPLLNFDWFFPDENKPLLFHYFISFTFHTFSLNLWYSYTNKIKNKEYSRSILVYRIRNFNSTQNNNKTATNTKAHIQVYSRTLPLNCLFTFIKYCAYSFEMYGKDGTTWCIVHALLLLLLLDSTPSTSFWLYTYSTYWSWNQLPNKWLIRSLLPGICEIYFLDFH